MSDLLVIVPAVQPRKLLARIRRGSLVNVRFEDMRRLVEAFGFRLQRVHGSHHIFAHSKFPELLNLQEVEGEAKPLPDPAAPATRWALCSHSGG